MLSRSLDHSPCLPLSRPHICHCPRAKARRLSLNTEHLLVIKTTSSVLYASYPSGLAELVGLWKICNGILHQDMYKSRVLETVQFREIRRAVRNADFTSGTAVCKGVHKEGIRSRLFFWLSLRQRLLCFLGAHAHELLHHPNGLLSRWRKLKQSPGLDQYMESSTYSTNVLCDLQTLMPSPTLRPTS